MPPGAVCVTEAELMLFNRWPLLKPQPASMRVAVTYTYAEGGGEGGGRGAGEGKGEGGGVSGHNLREGQHA